MPLFLQSDSKVARTKPVPHMRSRPEKLIQLLKTAMADDDFVDEQYEALEDKERYLDWPDR